MADTERPSPFTIPEPAYKTVEGPPTEPCASRSMTVRSLIQNLTTFADSYERAIANINRQEGVTKPWFVGDRDANTNDLQRDFQAIVAINRVRAYVLSNYGADLTIGTARRLLGDLIRQCVLAVKAAEELLLEEAMDKLDAVESRRKGTVFVKSQDARIDDKKHAVPPQTLRTATQLLEAFASAAAKFPDCPRMLAFLNTAREDGLVTVPPPFVPRKADGQPVVGVLNIGGTSKTAFGHGATFYGIGGARIASESGNRIASESGNWNVGFVMYGASNDEAATTFRELGSEAGVVVHVRDLVRGIQSYDRPLVLWSVIIYETLQGSAWLSKIEGAAETPALHFNPFTASVETLKRLLAREKSSFDRPLLSPKDGEPSALENSRMRIRDPNGGLQSQSNTVESEKPTDPAPAVATGPVSKRSTERGEGRTKLIAALTRHHQYADGGCLNLSPVGNNELAKAAGVSPSTASAFFHEKFKGHTKYKSLCRNAAKLTVALKLLNDEFAPYHLLGEASSDLAAHDEEDTDGE